MKMAHRIARIVPRLAAVALSLAGLWLAPGTAFAAVAQQVQSGTVVNTANGIQVVNIAGVDPAKSFLIFETRHTANRPVAALLRGRMPIACANPCTTIEFERVTNEGAPAAINIQWYVVTFVTGVRVQRGETTQDSLFKNVTLPLTLSAVNQAFVLWSKTTDSPAANSATPTKRSSGEITSTTTVQFRSNDAVPWTSSRGRSSSSPTPPTSTCRRAIDHDAGPDHIGHGHLEPAGRREQDLRSGRVQNNRHRRRAIGSRMLRAQLTDSTTITIERSLPGTPDDITEIFWQAIELKDKSTVVRGTSTFAVAAAQVNVPIAPHLDVSQSIAFGSVQSGAGQNMGQVSVRGRRHHRRRAPPRWRCQRRSSRWTGTTPRRPRRSTGSSWSSNRTIEARVLSGSYTGNGVNNRGIDVGFEPDFVILKTSGQIAVFRTSTMPQSPAASSKQSAAAAALVTNRILDFDTVNGGRFLVGTNAQVNAAGSIYYWTAFKAGAGKMAVGTYVGNSGTPVSVTGLEFSPEAVFVMGAAAQNPVMRVSGMANSTRFSADAGNANRITSLNADGFTVGTRRRRQRRPRYCHLPLRRLERSEGRDGHRQL